MAKLFFEVFPTLKITGEMSALFPNRKSIILNKKSDNSYFRTRR